jgi:hypothetical protein
MFNNTDILLRAACKTLAAHGDEAARFAQSRAEALRDDPMASAGWEQISHVISVIYDEGFRPVD